MTAQKYDVVVAGAGAAGLMCAIRAVQRGKKVLLLDHGREVGAKILISGGGRCNFTNLNVSAKNYISQNPHFCISALAGFTPQDFIALIEKHKIAYHEKTLGQLFCDGSARQIVSMLLTEATAANVEIKLGCRITAVEKPDDFVVRSDNGNFAAPALILATGGLSIPKLGTSSFAYDIAKKFGLNIVEPRPALVPLAFGGEEAEFMKALSGVSLPITATCGKTQFAESMVFTHRGLSGPAILQISSYWREGETVSLNLLPQTNCFDALVTGRAARPRSELKTILGELLPHRLAEALCTRYFGNVTMANLSNDKLQEIAALLHNWALLPTGTEGFAKAEVTAGGVDTAALSSKTMEAHNVPGLYVIGEAVDVTGWLGGYNFQWAWASGWAAGNAL